MRRAIVLLGALLALSRPAFASFTYAFDANAADSDNLAGLHLNRAHNDTFAHGISWDIDRHAIWNAGLDVTLDYSYPGVTPTPPDLVFAYRPAFHTDNFRMRWDDCRLWLGQRVGHPAAPFQFTIDAGRQDAPLGGLLVGTYGSQQGLLLFNRGDTPQTPLKRTSISMFNQFMLQTDTRGIGVPDFWLYNYGAQAPTFWVGADNAFQLASAKEGFFGAAPVSKPVVTGSWSDGSAARSVLAALVKLGLVTNQTTP